MRIPYSNRRFKAMVFDLDDTLVDSRKDYSKFRRAAISELLSLGVDLSALEREGTVLANIQKGKDYLRRTSDSFDEKELDDRLNAVLNQVEMENIAEARAIPGAHRAVENALEYGMVVAVLTRASRGYTTEVLKALALSDMISACICRDDYPFEEAKPNPISMKRLAEMISVSPTECIFMGDHPMDAECAKACGAEFIGVLTGSTDRAGWERQGCDLVVDSVADAPSILTMLITRNC
jgi:phosphoglycolate phosphatase-like HAD superfamily hydrolase